MKTRKASTTVIKQIDGEPFAGGVVKLSMLRSSRAISFARQLSDQAERLLVALSHPRHGRTVLIGILIVYSAIWTIYAVVSKFTQGIHPDMGEYVAWSWHLDWGTPKHPPLLPAIVRLWFSVFPLTDWAFYLLAVLASAISIYCTWLVAGFWLEGMKRAVVPFLLMLIPFYNFLGLRLDHNVLLIPLWAMTTYAFVKSFETRNIPWSVIAGFFAGLAVLAKYWSFFLLLGLATAALVDTRRWEYLKSWCPWIITAISFCLFLPHLVWLEANQYPTFVSAQYRLALSATHLITGILKYFSGSMPYVAAPLILLAVLVRPSRRVLADVLLPKDRERRFAAIAFWTPMLVPIPFAVLAWTHLSGFWTMSGFALFAVVLLSSPAVHLTRKAAATIASVAIIVSVGALAASPFVAAGKLWSGIPRQAAYTHNLADEIQKLWDRNNAEPLMFVGGDYDLVNPVTFYLDKKSLPISFFALSRAPWDSDQSLDQFGAVFICAESDKRCRSEASRMETGRVIAEHTEIVIQPRWGWFAGESRTFVADIVIPHDWSRSDDDCCISAARRFKRPPRSGP